MDTKRNKSLDWLPVVKGDERSVVKGEAGQRSRVRRPLPRAAYFEVTTAVSADSCVTGRVVGFVEITASTIL